MRRTARATWLERVEKWKASGLTASAFARKHGLREKTLKWWKWQLGARPKREMGATIAPLTFVEMTSPVQRDAFEVVLVSGVRIRLPSDFDDAILRRVVDVLDRAR